MTERNKNEYKPDFVTPPGGTLDETLKSIGMTQRELALRTGRPLKTINEIVKGKAGITPDTALQLERVLGISASFWNNREQQYREYLARKAEEDRLCSAVLWLKQMPVKELTDHGWIRKFSERVDQLRELLGYFGVTSPEQYSASCDRMGVAFRMSKAFRVNEHALAAWLRKGVLEAQNMTCSPYRPKEFRNALHSCRTLTCESPEVFEAEIKRRCALSGVAVVFVRELKGTRTSGATRWLTKDKALLQLSLRYKTNDMLWFSFFHEAAHILLHGKRAQFLEYGGQKGDAENEADQFAENILIPENELQEFLESGKRSEASIVRFAAGIGIAPGIVVGRLQHDGHLPMKNLNGLKVKYTWATSAATND